MIFERSLGETTVSTDPRRLDVRIVHRFLAGCYWAKGIPLAVVRRSLQNSLCFGVYHGKEQAGFARVITDRATFAYLADVFILEVYRGRGLSKFLMQCIMAHPELQGLRRWSLVTKNAHALYTHYGFKKLAKPERWMEIHHPDVYTADALTNQPMSR